MSRRPEFISRELFRQWLPKSQLNKLLTVDNIAAMGYIDRCARLGKPIKSKRGPYRGPNKQASYSHLYRALDIVTRAYAEGVSVGPPKRQADQHTHTELKREIRSLTEELGGLKQKKKMLLQDVHATEFFVRAKQQLSRLKGLDLVSRQELIRNKIPMLPTIGVYFLIEKDEIVYVGQSVNVFARVSHHYQDGEKVFDSFCYISCEKEELNILESLYILIFQPRCNGYHGISRQLHAPMSFREIATRLKLQEVPHASQTMSEERQIRPQVGQLR